MKNKYVKLLLVTAVGALAGWGAYACASYFNLAGCGRGYGGRYDDDDSYDDCDDDYVPEDRPGAQRSYTNLGASNGKGEQTEATEQPVASAGEQPTTAQTVGAGEHLTNAEQTAGAEEQPATVPNQPGADSAKPTQNE